jgi:hypothetical protein
MADNKTRRVIEVQSDLFQKGNLEKEFGKEISAKWREFYKTKEMPIFKIGQEISTTPIKGEVFK